MILCIGNHKVRQIGLFLQISKSNQNPDHRNCSLVGQPIDDTLVKNFESVHTCLWYSRVTQQNKLMELKTEKISYVLQYVC